MTVITLKILLHMEDFQGVFKIWAYLWNVNNVSYAEQKWM
jgi:hypothetical protein